MSEWTARITDHRVWNVMAGLGPKIDEAENVESLERLRAVLAFCGKRLGASDPLTMTIAPSPVKGVAEPRLLVFGIANQSMRATNSAHGATACLHACAV